MKYFNHPTKKQKNKYQVLILSLNLNMMGLLTFFNNN